MKTIVTVFSIVVIIAAMTAPTWAEMEVQDNVVVFVIDSTSAILKDDQRLLSQFNTFSHGEAVSKIIGTKVYQAFNVDDPKGNIDGDKYRNALYYILNRVGEFKKGKRVVINMSLGSPLPSGDYPIIRQLYRKGVIMVASAGNEAVEGCCYPAAYDEVISVAACEKSVIAEYSNNCKDIDIVADGEYTETRTRSMFFGQSIEKLTLHGTSFSAPRVTSIIVEMLKQKPELSKDEIVDILQRASTELLYSKCKGGRVNRLKALAEISDNYRRLYRIRNWGLIVIATISTVIVGGFLASLLLVFVLSPALTFLFRLFLPGLWLYIKKKEVQKVMNKKEKNNKDIRFVIKCLIAQDSELEQIAKKALLDICKVSVLYRLRVCDILKSVYHHAKINEFVDERTPIKFLLAEIDLRFQIISDSSPRDLNGVNPDFN